MFGSFEIKRRKKLNRVELRRMQRSACRTLTTERNHQIKDICLDIEEQVPLLLYGVFYSGGSAMKQVRELSERYVEQHREGRYFLHDGTRANDQESEITQRTLLNIVGHNHIVKDKCITNCPAIAAGDNFDRSDRASLRSVVRLQKHGISKIM